MSTIAEGTILGVNRVSYPSSSDGTGYVSFKVVLVAGAIGDYAAYAGDGPAEWVRSNGDKLSFEMACGHFPGGQLQEERYRR